MVLQRMMNTGLKFNVQIGGTYEARTPGGLNPFGGPDDRHEVHVRKGFSVDPQTLTGGNLVAYTYGRLLVAMNDYFQDRHENERLKKAVSELTLDKLILKEALTGKY